MGTDAMTTDLELTAQEDAQLLSLIVRAIQDVADEIDIMREAGCTDAEIAAALRSQPS
jgi:hypothetical protein